MLKRGFSRFFTLALALTMSMALGLAAGCSDDQEAKAEKEYTNGIDASYHPFAYIDESGEPAGFDVDSMNWIAGKMGFKVRHMSMEWSTIVTSLLEKRIDMVASGMSISPERQKVVTFSNPYYAINKNLVVLKDSALTKDEILTGDKRLGVQEGTNEATWLEENKDGMGWNYTLRYYRSPRLAIEDLVNGRIDAAALDSPPANDAIGKGFPIKVLGDFKEGDDFGVATRNEDAELRNLINEGYKLLMADPYWEELKSKYDVQ
ncbi:MAG: ABC transporter substrate-binding protein [Deltaproteobacteria bacterium]|jgi:polar amino acid transport system substrate-binding protein|nr:ABC transporter substrate-binding protein [Deltaproteobacteria bacterium]